MTGNPIDYLPHIINMHSRTTQTLPENFIDNSQMLIFPTFLACPFRKMLLFSHRFQNF